MWELYKNCDGTIPSGFIVFDPVDIHIILQQPIDVSHYSWLLYIQQYEWRCYIPTTEKLFIDTLHIKGPHMTMTDGQDFCRNY